MTRNQTRTRPVSRRAFMQQSVQRAGWMALGALVPSVLGRRALAASDREANPFAYDLGRLQKTDPKLIGYRETGGFQCPRPDARRLAMGREDHLLLAAGSYITEMDRNGGTVSEIALGSPARCVAVAKDGTIYAGLRDHIEVFNAKGDRQGAWGAPGPRTWLTALVVGGNEVFAADAGGRVVWRYDRSGKVIGRIGEKNRARNVPGFIVPSPFFDLELPKDGVLRVVNPGRHRVEAYTLNGDFEFAWGKASASIEGFCGCCNPVSLALLPDDRFVTCEKGLPRVKVYGHQGDFQCVVAGPESFPENLKVAAGDTAADGTKGGLDAAVDSAGRVYVLDSVTGKVRVLVPKA